MNFFDHCKRELGQVLVEAGFERFRAAQLFRKVYQNSFDEKYLPTTLREFLKERFSTTIPATTIRNRTSPFDGTTKSLIQLEDNNSVEAVLIPQGERRTLCVSSQVGCSLSCTFCHTGTQKLQRNLKSSEIVAQFLLNDTRPTNIVFMGQGEPLYNWKNVARSVRILTDSDGLALSRNKITISTSGIAPLIPKIASELGVNLAVSLHAPRDDLRSEIMPINKTYDLAALSTACREFVSKASCTTRRISFEYVMLDGVNDDLIQAADLISLLKDLPAHINLIPFNPWPGSKCKTSSRAKIIQFADYLNTHGLVTSIRWSKGDDILAACGQLKSIAIAEQ